MLLLLAGQIWKFNDGKLENQNKVCLYSDKKWTLPEEGEKGLIVEENSKQALVAVSKRTAALLEKDYAIRDDCYEWTRSDTDRNGWFTLRNYETYGYLYVPKSKKILLTGIHY